MDSTTVDRIAGRLSALAREHAVEGYEAYLSETSKTSISLDDNRGIETLHADEERAIAVRVLRDQRLGFSFSFNPSDIALEEAFKRALDSTAVLERHPFSFVGNSPDTAGADLFYDSTIESTPNEYKLGLLNALIDAVHIDRRIVKVEKPSYEETISSVSVMNSSGVLKQSRTTRFGLGLSVIARQDRDSNITWDFQGANTFGTLDAHRLGKGCAALALKTLGGERLRTGSYDAVFTQLVASQFLGILARSFAADAVYKKTSLLADRLGQRVLPEHITITDDPLLKDGLGSVPFDAEGSPSVRKPLVDNGVAATFLYDNLYASLMAAHTTGNSVRPSVTQPPSIGSTNLVLGSDRTGEEDLERALYDGPVITELMGVHTVNPVTGEFSLGARGYAVKSGVFHAPLKDITVAGNLFDLLMKVRATGRDQLLYGTIMTPSLLITQLKIAGADA